MVGEVREDLWRRYARAVLEFGRDERFYIDLARRVDARARARLRHAGLGTSFAVVTASNPGGRDLPRRSNEARNRSLLTDLALLPGLRVPADGVSPDGIHRERGWAVVCPRDRAMAIGRRHGQLAVYWFDGERFWLVPCDPGTRPVPLPVPQ